MDSKLVLVKLITLVYLEGSVERHHDRSFDLANQIVSTLKLPEQITETETGRNTIVGLRETIRWMMDEGEKAVYDYSNLLQRVRLNAGDDESVFLAFDETIQHVSKDNDKEVILKFCESQYKELSNFVSHNKIKEIIKRAHHDAFYASKNVNWKNFVNDIVNDLEAYGGGTTQDEFEFVLDMVSTSDVTSIQSMLEKAIEDTVGGTGFKTGIQAYNRMYGHSMNLRRGMFVLVGGLTHNYKSGFVHDLFRQVCIYNTPIVGEDGLKPTLIYVSAENRLEEDLQRMYVALKENETKEAVDISQIDPKEAAEYVQRRLSETGFHVDMVRINAHDFTYMDLINLVLRHESEGREVQGIFFDYLALINKRGCEANMIGEDTRLLMQRTRTFMSARDILFVTPHQLSQEAMSLKRSGVNNFLGEIVGKNYWDGSKRIANEADLEIFVDIVQRNKKFWLHVCRGKHRTVKPTPVEYREFYVPFAEVGYILDDIDGEDSSVKTLTEAEGNISLDWDDAA